MKGKKRKYKILLLLGIGIAIFTTTMMLDNKQQYRYMIGKEAYKNMGEGDYEKALELFDLYLSELPNRDSFYWKLLSIVNSSDDKLNHENVLVSMEKCKWHSANKDIIRLP